MDFQFVVTVSGNELTKEDAKKLQDWLTLLVEREARHYEGFIGTSVKRLVTGHPGRAAFDRLS